jgi:uncharacterized membrane protein
LWRGGEGREGQADVAQAIPAFDHEATHRMDHERLIAGAARAVELAGVAVLLAGALLAAGAFLTRLARRGDFSAAYHALRADLGRAILLGLELLVIADIIGTVAIEPTLENLAVLAAIVAIRTALSFALELEVSGRWPWQRGEVAERRADGAP